MSNQNSKIFGIGLPRSGTTSLNTALSILGYNSIHHPTYYIMDKLKGSFNFDGYWDALTNFGEHFYPQLDELYPGSKFVLTVRDKEKWLNSCRWKYKEPSNHLSNAIRISIFGCDRYHEATFSYLYDAHTSTVVQYFKDRPDDLLIFNCDAGNGWDELCQFLGKEKPDIPFPVKNSKQELVSTGKPINYTYKKDLYFKNIRHYLNGDLHNKAFLGNPLANAILKYKRSKK